jgi:hypothetical protein
MKDFIVSTPCLSQIEIQNYLQSNIDDDTRYRVENHLLECPLCDAAVEGYAAHYNFDEHTDLDELESAVMEQYKLEKNQVIPIARSRPLLARLAAAAVILLVGAAGIWYYLNPSQTSEQLFLAYYEPTDVPGLSRVRGEVNEANLFEQALELYRQKNYAASQQAFEKLTNEEIQTEMSGLYAGLSALAADDLAAAIDHLGAARQLENDYWEDATWYLALSYLHQGDRDMSKILLEELIQRDLPYYQERAKQLLQDL